MNLPTDESAKAVQEVAKTTGKAIDATREAGGFIARFIAGPLEQGVGIFEDKLRYMRWERQQRLMVKAEETLKSLGLNAPTKPVPLKLAIPLLQAASIEDDDYLQDKWVSLLVNSANAGSGIDVSRAYIEILGQISPLEARILDVIYGLPFEKIRFEGVLAIHLPEAAEVFDEKNSYEREEEPPEEVKLALSNLARVGCLKQGMTWGGGESFLKVSPTILGRAFVEACRVKKT